MNNVGRYLECRQMIADSDRFGCTRIGADANRYIYPSESAIIRINPTFRRKVKGGR